MLEAVQGLARKAASLTLVATIGLAAIAPAGAGAVTAQAAPEQITGTVAFNGGYAEDAQVSAVAFTYDASLKSWDAVAASDVATSGAYAIDLPGSGTYRIGFFDSGLVYADRYYVSASKVESATDIAVAPAQVVSAIDETLTALPEYIIEGKVAFVGETGPAEGVGVTVYSYDATLGATALLTRRTKPDGTYRIHLPAVDVANGFTGTYRVGFTDFDDVFSPAYYDATATVDTAADIVVNTPGTTATGVDATLTAQPSTRITSVDIHGLGVDLSKKRFEDGSGVPVVLASGYSWRDLASAGPLSHALGGPLLSTGKSVVPQRVLAEIARLGSTEVVIVGGVNAVPLTQEFQLRKAGVSVVRRLQGRSAAETAVQVADEMVNSGLTGDAGLEVAIVPVETPVTSIAAASVFDTNDIPVLFTNKKSVPASTADFLKRNVPSRSLIMGGSTYVTLATRTKFPNRKTFSDTTAAGIGTKVAAYGVTTYGQSDRIVGLVSSSKPEEAFVAATYLASKRLTATSTKATSLDTATKTYLTAQKPVVARVIAAGTAGAFNASTFNSAANAVK